MVVNRRVLVASAAALSLAGCGQAPDYVNFTREKREHLQALRKAGKFNPEKSELRSYPGPDDPENKDQLNQIINACLDGILVEPDGRLDGDVVREQFIDAMKKLDHFSPQDNDRAIDYMLETWRTLGFRTRTGVLGEPDNEAGSIQRLKQLVEQVLSEFGGGGSKK